MVAEVGGPAAILEQEALVAAVVGLTHRGMDADIGRDPGQHDVLDPPLPQEQIDVGREEGSLAGLVDDGLAGGGCQLRDDLR